MDTAGKLDTNLSSKVLKLRRPSFQENFYDFLASCAPWLASRSYPRFDLLSLRPFWVLLRLTLHLRLMQLDVLLSFNSLYRCWRVPNEHCRLRWYHPHILKARFLQSLIWGCLWPVKPRLPRYQVDQLLCFLSDSSGIILNEDLDLNQR